MLMDHPTPRQGTCKSLASLMSLASLALLLALPSATAALAAGSVELVSRIDPGQVSDTASGDFVRGPFPLPAAASLSADGRYAAFLSSAANLAPGQRDVNGEPEEDDLGQDVFLADLVDGTVTLVSHAMGLPATTGNQGSSQALISADGRWVLFSSAATDLVPGQQGHFPYHDEDLLLYDRLTGAITLVAATREEQAYLLRLGISADGRYVTYDSDAWDQVPGMHGGFGNVFLYDRVEGSTRLVSHVPGSPLTGPAEGGASDARISADGRFILYITDGADLLPGQISTQSVVLYDRVRDTLTLVGPGERGADLSADGNYAVFGAGSTLRLYSRATGATTVVSTTANGTNDGNFPRLFALNADGRYLVFSPYGGNSTGLAVYDRVSRATTPVSRPAQAPPLSGSIGTPAISADGRYVVFASSDPAWVAGQTDANTHVFDGSDVFLLDRSTGKVALVSHSTAALTTTGNAASYAPAISAGGARVVYLSQATDLEEGLHDLNQRPDLFAYDPSGRSSRAVTRRASGLPSLSSPLESRATSLSADGRLVAFETYPDNVYAAPQADVHLYDPATKTTLLIDHVPGSAGTPAKGVSLLPVLSPDGGAVAFLSTSRALVPGANPAGAFCLFVFDRTTGAVTFVARLGDFFTQDTELYLSPPRFSADGRWLAFTSKAPDVVPGQQEADPNGSPTDDVFLFDRVTGRTTLVSHSAAGPLVTASDGSPGPLALSADGRYLAFLSGAPDLVAGQGGQTGNLFLWDRVSGQTTLVSHARGSALSGAQAAHGPAMSADGRFLAFTSRAMDLDPAVPPHGDENVYVYDRVLGTFQWAGSYAGGPVSLAMSDDGRILAFPGGYSVLPGVGPGVFLYDRVAKAFSLVAEAGIESLALSGNGRFVAFASDTPGLVPGLTRTPGWGGTDLYLFDRTTGATVLANPWLGSAVTAAGFAGSPLISADGQRVAFNSRVDLVAGDYNRQLDGYLFRLDSGDPGGPGGPVALPPCILFDTRRPADGPALRSNAARVVKAAGACGVPATARRVAVRVTALQPTGKGNLRFYPGDLSAPSTGILRFARGQTRDGAFDLPVAPNGAGTLTLLPLVGGNGTVGVSVEMDGYTP
jgi:Tol biopolymer transport system component